MGWASQREQEAALLLALGSSVPVLLGLEWWKAALLLVLGSSVPEWLVPVLLGLEWMVVECLESGC